MRTTKVQKLTAFVLALLLLFSGTVAVGAKDANAEESTLSSIKELLNAISYNEYQNLEDFLKAENATEEISISGLSGVYVNSVGDEIKQGDVVENDADADKNAPRKYVSEGKEGLYVPDSGTVSWIIDGITTAKYNIEIEYYPVVNKSASIERIFMINGEVPFAEARYLSISKVWQTPYKAAKVFLGNNDSAADIIAKATAAGFVNASEKTDSVTGKQYVECIYPGAWTQAMADFVSDYTVRFFNADIDKNEIRDSLTAAPTWQTYTLKDSNGFAQEPFVFLLEPDDNGKVTLSLESVNEPIVISEIKLTPVTSYGSYADYTAKYDSQPKGEGEIKIEAEYFSAVSDQTIYPASDTTSAANSPVANDRTMLNVIGGNKWQGVGQWIEYDFKVTKSGMYNIALRHKQNILDGMSVSRVLYLYSDQTVAEGDDGYYNGVPFDEATKLKFGYSDKWEVSALSASIEGSDPFEFYFKEGVTYKLRLEVSLGSMGDIVRRVQESLDAINTDYLNILKLTGTSPDEFVDYQFYNKIPQTMNDMWDQHEELKEIADLIAAEAGSKSSMTATLVNVYDLLKEMSSDEAEVAKNMEQLKTYIGSLGTWLGDAKTQPLLVDYLVVKSPDTELPKAEANFFEALWHEISGFFQSFFREYDRMGALTEEDTDENVEVWLAYGRDQSQVIRNLINNGFTAEQGITVNLKLVAGGTLLPSILAGKGPDVYLGLGSGDVINYDIRGALEPIENMKDYDATCDNFNEEAMMVLRIEDAEGIEHCYGLPETQSFSMMFVREDILANLNLEIPKTWDDIKEAIPVLQANNMEIAMGTDPNLFIYQMGGELFADNGMRINLDSNLCLNAFETMCELFTMYSFPYTYDFANRFRTGEMPIGIADYTGTYNHLKVFATELEGLWGFYPLPGIEDEEGNINNDGVSGVSAVVMITDSDQQENAWEFMKWYVGAECQTDYTNEMVAILGPSAKHPTANKEALESLPWTREEYDQVKLQFDNLAGIPNYPGAYIIGRYTNFAFLDAYNDNANPVESLRSYIDYINDEITRKRDEFGLETLDKSKQQSTLAVKRMQQAIEALDEAKSDSGYVSAYDATYDAIVKELRDYNTKDHGMLDSLALQLEEHNATLFADAANYLKQAAACLRSYEAYN